MVQRKKRFRISGVIEVQELRNDMPSVHTLDDEVAQDHEMTMDVHNDSVPEGTQWYSWRFLPPIGVGLVAALVAGTPPAPPWGIVALATLVLLSVISIAVWVPRSRH